MKIKEEIIRTMSFEELENEAMKGNELPKEIDCIHQTCFLALRALYASWRRGYIYREQAEMEKRCIRLQYIKALEEREFMRNICRHMQEHIIKGETLKAKVLKNLRLEKNVLWDAIMCIGAITSDDAFITTAKKYNLKGAEENEQNTILRSI